MCILKINRFYGRSGNNILQLLNCIKKCKLENIYSLECINHNLFTLQNTIVNPLGCKCTKKVCGNNELILKPNKVSLSELKEIFYEFCKFTFTNSVDKIYDIGIHIRSGDIFRSINSTHRLYLQPPLYFYKKIINDNINKNIVIVFENKNNPVINELIKEYTTYNNIKFQSSDLKTDIITLANCRKLVFSNGTFCLIPYILSKHIETIITPDFLKNNIWFSLNIENNEIINLPNFIDFYSWKNSIQQQKILLEYNL